MASSSMDVGQMPKWFTQALRPSMKDIHMERGICQKLKMVHMWAYRSEKNKNFVDVVMDGPKMAVKLFLLHLCDVCSCYIL